MKALPVVFLALFLVGCVAETYGTKDEIDDRIANLTIPQQYKVSLYQDTTSSGGTRILDVRYIVQDGNFVACEGNYTFSRTEEMVVRCTRDTLRSGEITGLTMEQVALELQTRAASLHKEGDCYADAEVTFCFDGFGALVSYVDMGRGGVQWKAEYETQRIAVN